MIQHGRRRIERRVLDLVGKGPEKVGRGGGDGGGVTEEIKPGTGERRAGGEGRRWDPRELLHHGSEVGGVGGEDGGGRSPGGPRPLLRIAGGRPGRGWEGAATARRRRRRRR